MAPWLQNRARMKRTLLALAVAVPAAVLAAVSAATGQVVEIDNYSAGSSYVNAAQCAGAAVKLEWSISPAVIPSSGDTFRIYASNTKWATSGTDANYCPEANGGTGSNVFADLVTSKTAAKVTEQLNVIAATIVAKAGMDCTSASESKVVYVCVHQYGGATKKGYANGQFIVQLAAPDAPTGVSVGVGPELLEVSWTESTSGATEADHFIAAATPVDATGTPLPGATTVYSSSVNGTSVTISGLTDGQRYSVVVRAYSIGGNPSIPSAEAFGAPSPVEDFWEIYTSGGGREQGGCGTGGAGPFALLALAGLLAAIRRRN